MAKFKTGFCSRIKDLKVLLPEADEQATIVLFTRTKFWIKHFLFMVRQGYKLRSKSREYDLTELRMTGRVVSVWTRTLFPIPETSTLFCRGVEELHARVLAASPIRDLEIKHPLLIGK